MQQFDDVIIIVQEQIYVWIFLWMNYLIHY